MIELLSQMSSVIAISSKLGDDANRTPKVGSASFVLVQFPVSTGLDCPGQTYQCRFLEMAPDQHQADRQSIDAAAWHCEGRVSGHVERACVSLHIERGIDHGVQRRPGRRDRRCGK